MPLGSLGRNTIVAGWKVLSEIAAQLKEREKINQFRGRRLREMKQDRSKIQQKLVDLSNKFYMTVPHDFGNINHGFVKPQVIDSTDTLNEKSSLLQSMEDVESSLNLLMSDLNTNDSKEAKTQPPAVLAVRRFESLYQHMGVDIRTLPKDSPQYKLISGASLSPSIHSRSFNLTTITDYSGDFASQIVDILRVTRWEDSVRFSPYMKQRFVLVDIHSSLPFS